MLETVFMPFFILLKLFLDVQCASSIATVHALQFTALIHLRHDVDAHRYLSKHLSL